MGGKEKKFDSFTFKERFKELLENTNEQELEKEIGVSASAFRQWTNGYTLPTSEKLMLLSRHFNVSTDYLLGLSEYHNEDEIKLVNEARKMLIDSLGMNPVDAGKRLSQWFVNLLQSISKTTSSKERVVFIDYLISLLKAFTGMLEQSYEMRLGTDWKREYIILQRYYDLSQEQLNAYRNDLLNTVLKARYNDTELHDLVFDSLNGEGSGNIPSVLI